MYFILGRRWQTWWCQHQVCCSSSPSSVQEWWGSSRRYFVFHWNLHQWQWLCSTPHYWKSQQVNRTINNIIWESWECLYRLLHSMKAIDELKHSNMKLFEIWKENIFKIPDVTKDMQEIVKVCKNIFNFQWEEEFIMFWRLFKMCEKKRKFDLFVILAKYFMLVRRIL